MRPLFPMALTQGTRLGPYEILSAAGAGGMGEVYRARDTRLGREVAIKVLPEHLSSDPRLKERFEREARAISSLNHPHICTLHDVGHQDGKDFLVMELLQGESLADRLQKGPLPLEQTLKCGIEIADALQKAHRQGIVHRDLKPGNIMLTKSGAKLLDFGLAKPTQGMAALASGSAATMTKPLTGEGKIVGTFQYMAPEQIQGNDADARTDIFALGAVLYEMVTGRRAFPGKSQISVMSAILEKEPEPISDLQPLTPAALGRLVNTCLQKDPDERFQNMHDLGLRLTEIAEAPAASTPTDTTVRRIKPWVWLAAAAAMLAMAIAGAYLATLALPPKQVVRSTLLAPEKSAFVTTTPDSGVPVLSPDGKRWAFIARDSKGELALYVRAIDSLTEQPLAGTSGAIHPFWSPDSRYLAFFADGKLKRVDATGGPVQELAEAVRGRGGAWGPDGTILFAPSISGPIMRVPAAGGTAVPASKLVLTESGHRWPYFLPDGKHFLFLARSDKSGICLGQLGSLDHKQLFENENNATYAPPGYLLFVRGETLLAQPFSLSKMVTTGEVIPVAEHVAINAASWRGVFSTSDSGVLMYQTGGASGGWQMQWVGRDGKPLRSIPDIATFLDPTISPDGKRVAVAFPDSTGGRVDLWILDLTRGTKTRLTFSEGAHLYPIWSPDGSRILYTSSLKGRLDIYSKAADGSGDEEVVLQDDSDKTWKSISRDGRYLAYQRNNPAGKPGAGIWGLPLFGDRKPFPIVGIPSSAGTPAISPDGKWLAYYSEETRRREVYITPFPGGGPKWQVSAAGGVYPKWRGDGREIYFIGSNGTVSAVEVTTSATSVTLGTPHGLFSAPQPAFNSGPYDVTRDGKQFFLNGVGAQGSDTSLTLVTNWTLELGK